MAKPILIALVAHDENRLIGAHGKIPWKCAEDLKWFKQVTMGKPILMGRKTFESIPGPLPGRKNIVISRTMQAIPDVQILRTVEEALSLPYPEIYLIGGGEIFQELLLYCEQLLVTHMRGSFKGDVYFPEYLHLFERENVIKEGDDFTIVSYRRKK